MQLIKTDIHYSYCFSILMYLMDILDELSPTVVFDETCCRRVSTGHFLFTLPVYTSFRADVTVVINKLINSSLHL